MSFEPFLHSRAEDLGQSIGLLRYEVCDDWVFRGIRQGDLETGDSGVDRMPWGVLTPFLGIPPEEKNPAYLNPEEMAQTVLNVVTAPERALVMKVVVVPRSRPFMVQEI